MRWGLAFRHQIFQEKKGEMFSCVLFGVEEKPKPIYQSRFLIDGPVPISTVFEIPSSSFYFFSSSSASTLASASLIHVWMELHLTLSAILSYLYYIISKGERS